MRRHLWSGTALAALGILAGAGTARADGPERLPLSFAQRPLTLPKMTLAPEAGIGVTRIVAPSGFRRVYAGADLGARFGILDDLEVGAVVLPLRFSPDFTYGNPRLSATFRFFKGDVEIGARLGLTFVTEAKRRGMGAEPGVPVLIHLGESARIDTGFFVPMSFDTGYILGGITTGDGPDTTIALRIPFQFSYNVTSALHFGARTGFEIAAAGEAGEVGAAIVIPLGVVAGYAVGNEKGPLVDFAPYFTFPSFATPSSSGDKINPGVFQAGITATVYLYL